MLSPLCLQTLHHLSYSLSPVGKHDPCFDHPLVILSLLCPLNSSSSLFMSSLFVSSLRLSPSPPLVHLILFFSSLQRWQILHSLFGYLSRKPPLLLTPSIWCVISLSPWRWHGYPSVLSFPLERMTHTSTPNTQKIHMLVKYLSNKRASALLGMLLLDHKIRTVAPLHLSSSQWSSHT